MGEMADESWAKTIPVANVQDLAASTNGSGHNIPHRYIRPELDASIVFNKADEKIPVIDMSKLLDPRFSDKEYAKLDAACQDWGFFQLVNHGVPDELMEQIKDDLRSFFNLSLQEKQVLAPVPGGIQGYGQNFVTSDEQKLDWNDFLYVVTHPIDTRNMRFWPTTPPTFRSTLDKYSMELTKVTSSLVGIIAKNLGVVREVFSKIFGDQHQGMRMNYYPPCPKADKVLGLSPHTDASCLTLLFQVGDVHGLQIRRNGNWFPVEALQNALLVNIGDAFEILSNGKYKSIEHRVLVNNEKDRLSIAAYHSPDTDTKIGPLPELVNGGEAHYKTMNYMEFKKYHFSSKLEGKSHMGSMRLKK